MGYSFTSRKLFYYMGSQAHVTLKLRLIEKLVCRALVRERFVCFVILGHIGWFLAGQRCFDIEDLAIARLGAINAAVTDRSRPYLAVVFIWSGFQGNRRI